MKKIYFTAFCFTAAFPGLAMEASSEKTRRETAVIQPAENPDTTSLNDDEAKKGKFSFSGYADSYYTANFNKPLSRTNTGYSEVARVFDTKANQFMLGLVQGMMNYSNGKSEVVADLVFGPNANAGNYGNALFSTALIIKQAYFKYNFTDKFSATVGQFGTHIGYEVIDAPVNFNYSLSYLFGNGPFYHAGLKATYAFSDRVSLMAGVVNNVDGLGDNNRQKGIISQLFVSPVDKWNIYLNFINSNEADPGAPEAARAYYRVYDLTTSFEVTDNFLLGLNAAIGSQRGDMQGDGNTGTKSWGGIAGYANIAFTDHIGLGARYEFFDNTSGVRALVTEKGGTSVNAFTLTGNVKLADGHLLLKPEFRVDSFRKGTAGEVKMFQDSKGNYTKSSQSTLGLAFIYKF